jgi:RimJ/RimL family protein N-acetyltransferase
VYDDWPPRPLRWPERGLSDAVVTLDRMSQADVPAIVAAIDEEILRWLPLPAPYTTDDAVAFLGWQAEMAERGLTLNFAVRSAPGGPLLGSMGLHFRSGPGVGEIGYWIAPSARRQGLATAGIRLIAAFAFTAYGPRRVELLVQPGNVYSRRAALRAGATYEGIRRAGIDDRGDPRDAAVFSFLPTDGAVLDLMG